MDEDVQVTPEPALEAEPEPEATAAEALEEEPTQTELTDERGVPWKNVAKEQERKAGEAQQKAELLEKLLTEGRPTPEPETPEPKADPTALWNEGKFLEAVGMVVRSEVADLDAQRQRRTSVEGAAKTREKLLEDYPDLADKRSELFKATVDSANELKQEWAAMGLNVDVKALEKDGRVVHLERQAVERAIVNNPALAPDREVEAMKRKQSTPAPAQAVTQATGKPPVSKKPAAAKSEGKVSAEDLELMKLYGLKTDEASQKRYLEAKKTVGYFSEKHRREEDA